MDNAPAFRNVASFSQEASLSSQQAIDLFNFGIQIQRQVLSAMAATDSPEVLRPKVSAILQTADGQLVQLLDDKTRSAYLQSAAGKWLNRLQSGEMPPPTGGTTRGIISTGGK